MTSRLGGAIGLGGMLASLGNISGLGGKRGTEEAREVGCTTSMSVVATVTEGWASTSLTPSGPAWCGER